MVDVVEDHPLQQQQLRVEVRGGGGGGHGEAGGGGEHRAAVLHVVHPVGKKGEIQRWFFLQQYHLVYFLAVSTLHTNIVGSVWL